MPPIRRWMLLAALVCGPAGSARAEDWAATGAEIVALVRDNFFDKARGAAWADRHANYAASARDRPEFVRATREALARLEASHTDYFTPDDSRYHGLLAIFGESLPQAAPPVESIGVDVAPGSFVRVVFAGSPAAQAGLKRGDKILGADGAEFDPVRSCRGRAGRPIRLSVQTHRDEAPHEVVVTPRAIDPQREWLEAQRLGAQVVAEGGSKVAIMPFFSAAGEAHQYLLRAAIAGQFAEADALVLDFRDGWGGANPDFVSLFSQLPPVLENIGRDGIASRYDPQWRKPLVILINEGSRSGKEIVAHAVQQRKLGTLVGARTAGAVLAGRPFLLRDQSVLYLAVLDVHVDGVRLEGRGVTPDVPVPDDLPFAHGADPQLRRALEIAAAAAVR